MVIGSDETRGASFGYPLVPSAGTRAEGPGQISRILDESSAMVNSEIGGRIAQSLESWSSAGTVRRIVEAENETIAEFKKICDSKLKLLMLQSASLSAMLH